VSERVELPVLPLAEALATFVCPDPSGQRAPCRSVGQRDGPQYHPRIRLADDREHVCPVWLTTRCVLYEQKYTEWLEVGEGRGIRPRFIAASLNGERRTPALDVVRSFVRGPARRGRALLLLGPHGVGKTWALSAAIHAWPDPRGPLGDPLYVEAAGFIRDLLRWSRTERRQHPLDTAIEASFLAIDDLGVGYIKKDGYAAAALEEVLHHRHAERLPLLAASNWSPRELARRLSPRTFDRIREWGEVVELSGASLREPEPEEADE